jgi:GNAT superfamily N-acetyltransferase
MSLDVRPARSFREVGAFIDLPFRLHAGTPWVPPLKLERRWFLSRRLGTYARRVDFELFLATRAGRVVGRISAHVDHAYNRHHDARWGWFGFFDCEDDPEVAHALLRTAERWLRDRGMERMVGPADFTMNDESGLVIEGNELEPMLREPWHPPYYRRLIEGAGFEKVVDLFMWRIEISDRERMRPILPKLARDAQAKHGVRIRRMSRRGLRRDLDAFADIYNVAWRRNWGFVPYGPRDLDAYAQELQLVFDRDWFMVAEIDGRPIAVAITVPDLNQVLRRMNGRLLPFGWWHYLRRRRIVDRVRVGFLGVRPEYQHTGAAAALYLEHFATSDRHPRIKWGETGWVLETNRSMNRAMEAMGGRIIKRYRVYGRDLGPAPVGRPDAA